jgi:hypothetical protein
MRISSTILCFGLFAVLPLPSSAQTQVASEPAAEKVPPLIYEGLHQLANQHPEEAERAWARGTVTPEQATYANQLRTMMLSAGAYQYSDVVSVQDIAPRLRVIYLVLNFEKLPNIARFLLYKSSDGWVLIDHKFNIDERIFEPVAQPEHQ